MRQNARFMTDSNGQASPIDPRYGAAEAPHAPYTVQSWEYLFGEDATREQIEAKYQALQIRLMGDPHMTPEERQYVAAELEDRYIEAMRYHTNGEAGA
jgi:hypothetical protein